MLNNNMEALQEKLTQSGLTRNESKVYLELTKHKELSANQIAKNLGIDRTLTYTILNHLIEKGQISYIIKEKIKLFKAESPENLLNPLKEKEFVIKDLIKELSKIKSKEKTNYEVKIFEGKEGLRTLMKLIVEHKSFLSWGATGRAYDILYELKPITEKLEKQNKGQYIAQIIMNEKYRNHEFTKYKGIKTKYLKIKSETTTTIFGDYVSIHLAKEKPLIILIKNKEIAEGYKNYFQALWKIAKF